MIAARSCFFSPRRFPSILVLGVVMFGVIRLEPAIVSGQHEERPFPADFNEPIRLYTLGSTRTQIVSVIQRNGSEAEIDAAVKAYANEAAAMTALEMSAVADILKAITPEQRGDPNAMRAAFFLMRGIFIDKKWDEAPEGKGY